MPPVATVTPSGSDDAAAIIMARDSLTASGLDRTLPALVLAASATNAEFKVSYPIPIGWQTGVPTSVNMLVKGDPGPHVVSILPLAGNACFPPFVTFDGAVMNGGVNTTDHKVSLAAPFMNYPVAANGYRTKANAAGILSGTPFDCGDVTLGWAGVSALSITLAIRREVGAWAVTGLCGINDTSRVLSTFGATPGPWRFSLNTQHGGILSLIVEVRDADEVTHEWYFPLPSQPAVLRLAFQLDTATGAAVAAFADSDTNWVQQTLTAVTPWTPGKKICHNWVQTLCGIGGWTTGNVLTEHFGAFDMSVGGFRIDFAKRWQDNGGGSALKFLDGQTVGALTGNGPDWAMFIDGASYGIAGGRGGFVNVTQEGSASPYWWQLAWVGGGAVGYGYWLRLGEAGTSTVQFRDLGLYGTQSSVLYGCGCHYWNSIGGGPSFYDCIIGRGAFGLHKLDLATSYVVTVDTCIFLRTSMTAWRMGYGLNRARDLDVIFWGLNCFTGAKAGITLDGSSFATDSPNAVHCIRMHAVYPSVFNFLGFDFEGTGPSGGHVWLDSAGNGEFDPVVIWYGGGLGTGIGGKAAFYLNGTPADRNAAMVVNTVLRPVFTGSGSLQEVLGGNWIPYAIPVGQAGPAGPTGPAGPAGPAGPPGQAGPESRVTFRPGPVVIR